MQARGESEEPRIEPGRIGPIILVLPLAVLLLGVLVARRAARPSGERASVPAKPQGSVRAWSGSLSFEQGGRLLARLSRLHPDPVRQAFDARALAQRLGLGAGEPWRLELTHLEGGHAPAAVVLEELRIRDDAGLAQAVAVESTQIVSASGIVQPLAVLLSRPRVSLQPGEALSVILWGRKPELGVRLEGLALEAQTDPGHSLTLEPTVLTPAQARGSLARFDSTASPSAGPTPERR